MNIEQLKKVFLDTSIYDVFSIVQLISEVVSVFDDHYLDIYVFLEKNLMDLEYISLILFDRNGTIISEHYSDSLDFNLYLKFMRAIKECIIQLKQIKEENSEIDSQFTQIDDSLLSYLHQIIFKDHTFYIYALIKKEVKPSLLQKFPKFLKRLNKILKHILSQ